MRERIEDLERDAERAQVELAQELEKVRRSFRAELVPVIAQQPSARADLERSNPFPILKH